MNGILGNAGKWGIFCSNVRAPAVALCLFRALINEAVMLLGVFKSESRNVMVFKAERISSQIWEEVHGVGCLRRILRMREAAWDQPVSHIYSLPAAREHLCRGCMLRRAAVVQQVASYNAVLLWNIIILSVYSMVQYRNKQGKQASGKFAIRITHFLEW